MKNPFFRVTTVAFAFFMLIGVTAQVSKSNFGGRIMYDAAYVDADTEEGFGSEFRRLRLFSSGTINENIDYKIQLDFAGAIKSDGKDLGISTVSIKDAYIEFKQIPLLPISGSIKVGNFKEPFGLEELTSSKYLTFMERSLVMNAFSPSRKPGIMYATEFRDKKISFQLGLFTTDALKSGKDDIDKSQDKDITTRIAYGKELTNGAKVHVGLGYIHTIRNSQEGESYKFKVTPSMHLADKTTFSLGEVGNEDIDRVGLELAYVLGALALQGETVYLTTKAEGVKVNAFGTTGQVSYFITGDKKVYKSPAKGFGRIKPKKPFTKDGGLGALELAIRYSYLESNSEEKKAMSDITFGLNWYLNDNTRLMLNYVNADIRGDKGTLKGVQARVQVDF